MMKLKKNNHVVVITGEDKGSFGKITKRLGDRVVVEGVNICKRHVKAKTEQQKSGIFEIAKSIHISNVAPCDGAGKKVKLRAVVGSDGRKSYYYGETKYE